VVNLGTIDRELNTYNDKKLIEVNLNAIKEEAQNILIPKLKGIMVSD